ncbi:MAG: hypothetical protein ACP5HJ_03645 [Candidatus Micrarchaeia archaeon]
MQVSAPGKVLLLGGYSILERPNPGFVIAIDKRVYADINLIKKEGKTLIKLSIPQFHILKEGIFKEKELNFSNISEEELQKIKFVKKAIEVTLNYFREKSIKLRSFKLLTYSDPVFCINSGKSGLGSSAAVTVASVGAIFRAYGFSIKKNLYKIHNLSQISHSLAQNKIGSGFDVAAATFGSIKYVRYSPKILQNFESKDIVSTVEKKWDYIIKQTRLPNFFEIALANFVGTSASTTSLVSKVNEFKRAQPREYKKLIKKIKENDEKAIFILESLRRIKEKETRNNLLSRFALNFERSREFTKKLGELSGAEIEPEKYSKLIEKTKKAGAFVARLPGAGGGDSIVALCLSKELKNKVENFWKGYKQIRMKVLKVKIGNEGLREERRHHSFSL